MKRQAVGSSAQRNPLPGECNPFLKGSSPGLEHGERATPLDLGCVVVGRGILATKEGITLGLVVAAQPVQSPCQLSGGRR